MKRKKKLILPLAALLVCLCVLPAHAEEVESAFSMEAPDTTDTMTAETQVDDKNIIVNVTLPTPESPIAEDAPPVELPVDSEPVLARQTVKTLDIPDFEDSAVLSSLMQSVFGEYVPRTQTVTETAPDGSTMTYTECVPGLAGLDWYWISGVALFALVLLSFMKMVGVLLKQ